ncbi:MAG: ribosome maturation factor RimP [Clostridiales bacterium]|mgnify:FL=1|nr:ribosome maturation factor RimP [Clostridiales bacterium]
MSKRENYELKTESLVLPILEENKFELVDVEYVKEAGNNYLRIYIDKEGGITINDCELVSRKLSDLLDEDDFIPDAYILEVSSPGLGRPLKKEKDFARSIGKEVDVRLYKQIDKQKEFTGILVSYDHEKIELEIYEDEVIEIPRSNIALIRLAFDF